MKSYALIPLAVILASPALAQEDPTEEADENCCDADPVARIPDSQIVVVASGMSLNLVESGQSISVIDEKELTSIQGPDLARSLARLPGVTLTRNGGPGSFTGVRVRGAEAEQLLVLIDGVRVADVASPGGGFDFGNLLAANIEKIELLRGANSVAWGSQAIGGVMAVTTKDMHGATATAEYGSYGSLFATAAAGIGTGALGTTLGVAFHDTDGFSSAASGSEADGFRQWQVTGKAHARTGEVTWRASGRFAKGSVDIDGFPPPVFAFADTLEYQDTREWSGRVGADFESENLDLAAGFETSDTRRKLFDPAIGTSSYYTTYGRNRRADLRGQWRLPSDFRIDFGAERNWSRFSSTFDPKRSARQDGLYALLGLHRDWGSLTGGLRYDHHDRFGSDWTLGANGTVEIAYDWRLRGSFGEGFKSPTLFQLYSDFGNAALRPERSRSFDIGIEKLARNWASHFALTLFRRDSDNLIDFVSCFGNTTGLCANRPFGTYDNVGKARAEGIEFEADARPTDGLQLRAAYSFVKAVNRATGKDLARRPRHALSLSADWRTPLRDLTIGADLRAVSRSFDDAGNFVRLPGYALLTLRASMPVTDRIELYGRIENLTDKRYQTAAGYGTLGRSAYFGARARF